MPVAFRLIALPARVNAAEKMEVTSPSAVD